MKIFAFLFLDVSSQKKQLLLWHLASSKKRAKNTSKSIKEVPCLASWLVILSVIIASAITAVVAFNFGVAHRKNAA